MDFIKHRLFIGNRFAGDCKARYCEAEDKAKTITDPIGMRTTTLMALSIPSPERMLPVDSTHAEESALEAT